METIKGVVDGASNVLFGDQTTQQQRTVDSNIEPQNGVAGNTRAGEPYDGGNIDENTYRNTYGSVKVPGYSATDDAHAFETHHDLPRDGNSSGSRNTTTNAGSGLTGTSSNTYGSSNVEHDSQVANKLDPRVDSDRTMGHHGASNSSATGGSLVEGATGHGHHQTHGTGLDSVGGQRDESAHHTVHDTSLTGSSGPGLIGGQKNTHKHDTASTGTSGLTGGLTAGQDHRRPNEPVSGNTGGHGSASTDSASRGGMGNTGQMEDYGAGQAHGRANEPSDILGGSLGGGSYSKHAPNTEAQHSSVGSHGKHQGADAPLSGPDSRHESHAIRDTKDEAERKLNPGNDGLNHPSDKGLLEEKGIHHGEDKPSTSNTGIAGTEGTSKMAGGHAGGHSTTGHTGHSGAGETTNLGGHHDNSKDAGHHSSTTHAAEHGDNHEKLSLKDKIKAKIHKN